MFCKEQLCPKGRELCVALRTAPGCLPITFPHFEPGLILTSDDKDPNNGNLPGKEEQCAN